jgi:hypothetical protein
MTTQPEPTPHTPDAATYTSPTAVAAAPRPVRGRVHPALCHRLLTSGGNTPHYTAGDQEWTNWAHDNQWKGRISAFAMLLAGFIFLYFMAAIRSVLGSAESPVRGSAQLARVAFAGALTGIAGMTMAFVTLAACEFRGCRRESRGE